MGFVRQLHCGDCGVDISRHHYHRKYCWDCAAKRNRASSGRYVKASVKQKTHNTIRNITRAAVKKGVLPHPRTLACLDCGNPAECYDHRDYNKPLAVDPVCRRCNNFRGAGVPHISLEQVA